MNKNFTAAAILWVSSQKAIAIKWSFYTKPKKCFQIFYREDIKFITQTL